MSPEVATQTVAATRVEADYPDTFPFDPGEAYPEMAGRPIAAGANHAYAGVRECLRLLGYDSENYGKSTWNPLGHLIRPGQRVFIKPNLVAHEYRTSSGRTGDLFSVITHPAVVRAVADYVALALKGQGEIVIGDNPSIDADFKVLCEKTKLDQFAAFYPKMFGVKCRVLDLRPRRTDDLSVYGFKSRTVRLDGDPEGSSVLNLGCKSLFYGMNPLLFRGVFTKRWETIRHHIGDTQEYCISNTILNSDVYISVPKLKTHHKVGTTLNVKGLVGINSNKNYLVHWRIGFPGIGGDEFPHAPRLADWALLMTRHLLLDFLPESWFLWLKRKLAHTRAALLFHETKCASFDMARGSWDGNDTCWRMAADLYKVFVQDLSNFQRRRGHDMKFFSVVDGIVGGQENGPFYPLRKPAGTIVAGENLLAVDSVATRLMDFRVAAVPFLAHLLEETGLATEQIDVRSDVWDTRGFFDPGVRYLDFTPPTAWPHLAERQFCNQERPITEALTV